MAPASLQPTVRYNKLVLSLLYFLSSPLIISTINDHRQHSSFNSSNKSSSKLLNTTAKTFSNLLSS
jgi:hypothetical protein